MKIVICGTRDCPDAGAVIFQAWIKSRYETSSADITILHGASGNVDLAAKLLATKFKYSVKEFPAQWKAHGKAAGPIRNGLMAVECDTVLAIWDGHSRGTLDMIMQATRRGKPVYIFPIGANK